MMLLAVENKYAQAGRVAGERLRLQFVDRSRLEETCHAP